MVLIISIKTIEIERLNNIEESGLSDNRLPKKSEKIKIIKRSEPEKINMKFRELENTDLIGLSLKNLINAVSIPNVRTIMESAIMVEK